MSLVKTSSTTSSASRPSVHAFLRAAGRDRVGRSGRRRLRSAPPVARHGSGPPGVDVVRASTAAGGSRPLRLRRRLLDRGAGRGLRQLRVGAEVVGGSQQRRLVGVGAVELGHDLATEDHDRPVADELDLLQLGRVEEDGRAGRRQVAQEDVDLALRADVDPARRVEAEHRPDAAGDPAGDRDLLLVAARQPADLARRRARRSAASRPRRRPSSLLAAGRSSPSCRMRARDRQRDVLAHRALHQQRLGAIGGT